MKHFFFFFFTNTFYDLVYSAQGGAYDRHHHFCIFMINVVAGQPWSACSGWRGTLCSMHVPGVSSVSRHEQALLFLIYEILERHAIDTKAKILHFNLNLCLCSAATDRRGR